MRHRGRKIVSLQNDCPPCRCFSTVVLSGTPSKAKKLSDSVEIPKPAVRYIASCHRRSDSVSRTVSELPLETLEKRRKIAGSKCIFMVYSNYLSASYRCTRVIIVTEFT